MMPESRQFHRGFTYTSEQDGWVNGEFAILIPKDKYAYEDQGYDYPTEGKYAGFLWLALWKGKPIGQGQSLHKAIIELEDEGYIPVFDEVEEGETVPVGEPTPDDGNKNGDSDRYVSHFPATCKECGGIRMFSGFIRIYEVPKVNGGTAWQWQLTGKCHDCSRGKHIPVKKEFKPLIPPDVKAAALAAAGLG